MSADPERAGPIPSILVDAIIRELEKSEALNDPPPVDHVLAEAQRTIKRGRWLHASNLLDHAARNFKVFLRRLLAASDAPMLDEQAAKLAEDESELAPRRTADPSAARGSFYDLWLLAESSLRGAVSEDRTWSRILSGIRPAGPDVRPVHKPG